ncbi:MAG TPA: class I SAM-dependent rRNA methyltransferase, partial [Polyangiaceae bacterium]
MSGSPNLPKVRLRKDLRRALHAGQPWLYRDALTIPSELGDGNVVLVVGKDQRPLGRGFFSAAGPIAVRMLTTDKNDAIPALVRERLESALTLRQELLASGETTAFRWVHGEGDRLPGLHVDVYGTHASLLFDGPGARAFYLAERLPEVLLSVGNSLGLTGVLERGRRDASVAHEPKLLAGTAPQGEIEVREHGLIFVVDLVHGQKGGLFLDQRENRARVRDIARGRRVLNLFGYTGGFSLYAALGGATRTTTVDSAGAAIETARRNFARNSELLGKGASGAELVADDVFSFLERASADEKRYDLVISDPPSFAANER